MLVVLILLLVVIGGIVATVRYRAVTDKRRELESQMTKLKKVADEDVTVFGEELQDLHIETLTTELNTAMRQDYQRAINSYDTAKERLAAAQEPAEVRTVTEALEDGRYAMACVLARQNDEPLPIRRAPCFFNPQHGPSTGDVEWSPPGGTPRQVPVCTADADRLAQGAEPDIRMIKDGFRGVPYWKAGGAYQPYAMGYYGAYADILPAFFVLSMLNPVWMGGYVDDFDTGPEPDGGGGTDWGGDYGGGDYGGDSYGGGDGGFTDSGGFGGGGWDFGGGGFDGGGGF